MLSTNTGLVVANTSQFVAPVALVQSHGPVKMALTTEQIQMANALDVSPEMYRTGNAGTLQENYARYLCFLETEARFAQLWKDGTWPVILQKPSGTDIQRLFVGRSSWHDSWSKTFPLLNKHPEMQKWLQDDPDCLSDVELWGSNLKTYHFPELIAWVQRGGLLKKTKKAVMKVASEPASMLAASTSKQMTSSKKAAAVKKSTSAKAGNSGRK
ncbi:hypothetical protein CVT25_000061 [Psilocybe cyanescens]|uniref:Uncharacterized protein n=1 Tax=Psilocybe cyanescens TaxID=93625 RepID=A0A409XK81_PSICY|nr:hypothetical protein CVT25_000061 [Psilocybe cyanescens]